MTAARSGGAGGEGDAPGAVQDAPSGRRSGEALKDALQHSLDEARMVLPGIQTLFGFQLVVVFNPRFATALDRPLQVLHLAALVLVAVSAALVMTPAAYHRQTNGSGVSPRLLRIVSGFVSAALVPLMTALSLDVFLVARVILGTDEPAAVLGGLLFALLAGLWFAFPRLHPDRREPPRPGD